MPLSEHVHCVTFAFKMTERVEQWICIKFCIKFEHPSMETIRMIHHSNVPTHVSYLMQSFLAKHQIIWWFSPSKPTFGTLWLLAFSKTKITFEREEISDYHWDSGKYDGAADGNWENGNWEKCVGPYFEGDQGAIVLCTMFLLFCIFFNKCI